MIVRNWMQANPKTIPSDMLVSEAKRLLSENNLHALPVVDDGKLRGLVTRANLLRMGQFVLRLKEKLTDRSRVREVDLHLYTPEFARVAVDEFLRLYKAAKAPALAVA